MLNEPSTKGSTLARGCRRCHEIKVTERRFPRAGGFLLALSTLIGVAGGLYAGQPSLGFLAGLGAGLFLIAAVWALDQ